MRKRDTTLSTDQKALSINLDKLKYGSEVAPSVRTALSVF